MIKYLKHNEVDCEKWDACVDDAFNGMVYAYSWYLDMVNEEWEALVENDYERILALTPGKKFGINYLFQPRFTQQLGVFSRTKLTGKVVRDFLEAIPEKYRFIEINLNTMNKVDNPAPEFIPWLNHELDLIEPYETISGRYSTNLKRNLKKAAKSKLTIVDNIKPEDIIHLFRQNKGRQLGHLSDNNYQLLKRLIYVLIYKRMAQIGGVYNEMNELCAGAFFIKSNKKLIFYFSATNREARDNGAMPMLIDSVIREYAGSHLTFDFEGSNDPNLARFYKGFGAKELHYMHYRQTRLNLLQRTVHRILKMVQISLL